MKVSLSMPSSRIVSATTESLAVADRHMMGISNRNDYRVKVIKRDEKSHGNKILTTYLGIFHAAMSSKDMIHENHIQFH
jgi:hypothetical protein